MLWLISKNTIITHCNIKIKTIAMRRQLVNLLFILVLLVSCHEQDLTPEKVRLPKIAFTTLDDEPSLANAIKTISTVGNKAGRITSSLGNLKADSILKVLQSDSSSYTFTIRLKNEHQQRSFKNLVFRRTLTGFIGFILEYESTDGHFDLARFTGTVRKYDLEDKLLQELHFKNGSLETNNGGRTGSCNLVGFSKTCTEEIFDGMDQSTGAPVFRCNAYTIFITFDCQDDYNPNGSSGYGTYIADYYPGGGGGGSGASGNGNYDPDTQFSTFDEGDPIGVNPEVETLVSSVIAVEQLLLQDPSALIEIPCNQLPKWQPLAQNIASQTIKNKINQLNNNAGWFDNWAIQTLNGANGTIVNMDYFSVNVTTLPNNPTTGLPFTPEGFLDYFRKNINSFTEGSTFSPFCQTAALCVQETALWNSNNPTGAIVYIDIPGDDGVVVCSEYTSSYWYFMTIEAPGAGNHPVSGTRQFGFEPNGAGGYNFFVRGVDRFDSNIVENSLYAGTLGENPFFGADALWTSVQNKLKEFVTSKGGNAIINTPVKYRPDWEKVKDVLEGKRPLSDLGCK
jgi:hypothetical protein